MHLAQALRNIVCFSYPPFHPIAQDVGDEVCFRGFEESFSDENFHER